jgi:hypothetical protein
VKGERYDWGMTDDKWQMTDWGGRSGAKKKPRMDTNRDHEWTRIGTRMDANRKTSEPQMNQPSREAVKGKLQIYADEAIVERCLACEADCRGNP